MKIDTIKKVKKNYSKILLLLLVIIISPIVLNQINSAQGATQQEAYDQIILAYEKVQQISREGVDVEDLTADLNIALNLYHQENYDDAFAIASEVLDAAEELLANLRWGEIFPYVLIPINIVIVAAVIVFFGRNLLGWFRKKRDEEFMELEIVYEEPKEIEMKLEENQKELSGEENG